MPHYAILCLIYGSMDVAHGYLISRMREDGQRSPEGTNSIAVGATHGTRNQFDYSTLKGSD